MARRSKIKSDERFALEKATDQIYREVLLAGLQYLQEDLESLEDNKKFIQCIDSQIIPPYVDPINEWQKFQLFHNVKVDVKNETVFQKNFAYLIEKMLVGPGQQLIILPPHAIENASYVRRVFRRFRIKAEEAVDYFSVAKIGPSLQEEVSNFLISLPAHEQPDHQIYASIFRFLREHFSDIVDEFLLCPEVFAHVRMEFLLTKARVRDIDRFDWRKFGLSREQEIEIQKIDHDQTVVNEWCDEFSKIFEITSGADNTGNSADPGSEISNGDAKGEEGRQHKFSANYTDTQIHDARALSCIEQINKKLEGWNLPGSPRVQFVTPTNWMHEAVRLKEKSEYVPIRHPRLVSMLFESGFDDAESPTHGFSHVRSALETFQKAVEAWSPKTDDSTSPKRYRAAKNKCALAWRDFDAELGVYREAVTTDPGRKEVRKVGVSELLRVLSAAGPLLGDTFAAAALRVVLRLDISSALSLLNDPAIAFQGDWFAPLYDGQTLVRSRKSSMPYVIAFFSEAGRNWEVKEQFKAELQGFLRDGQNRLLDDKAPVSNDDTLFEVLLAAAFIMSSHGHFADAARLCERAVTIAPEGTIKVEAYILLSICSRAMAYRTKSMGEQEERRHFGTAIVWAFRARAEKAHAKLKPLHESPPFPKTPRLDLAEAIISRQALCYEPFRAVVETMAKENDGEMSDFCQRLLNPDAQMQRCVYIARSLSKYEEYQYFVARAWQVGVGFLENGIVLEKELSLEERNEWFDEFINSVEVLYNSEGWDWEDLPIGMRVFYLGLLLVHQPDSFAKDIERIELARDLVRTYWVKYPQSRARHVTRVDEFVELIGEHVGMDRNGQIHDSHPTAPDRDL